MILALLIVGGALWYSSVIVNQIQNEEREKVRVWSEAIKKKATFINITNNLFDRLREEERKKVELWASATEELANSDIGDNLNFLLSVVQSTATTVPIILVSADSVPLSHRNVEIPPDKTMQEVREVFPWFDVPLPRIINDSIAVKRDSLQQLLNERFPDLDFDTYSKQWKLTVREVLANYVVEWGNKYEPIVVEHPLGPQRLYYNDSKLFTELKIKRDSLMRSFTEDLVDNTALVPVLFMDSSQTHVIGTNLATLDTNNLAMVQAAIAEMGAHNDVIEVKLDDTSTGYLYYEDSFVLQQLRYYPFIMFGIIGLFLLISYFLFSTFRKAEQNQVWVGLAKETAHQLGTPLSSLMAWVELLKLKDVDPSMVNELNKDVERLEIITERFSKIGSETKLELQPLMPAINGVVNYLRTRISKKVEIIMVAKDDEVLAQLNKPLFEWVLENLLKNAVDAMEGTGLITIDVEELSNHVQIDITDTGKGIPSGKQTTVFEPGYTTKQRGWGLGLSLTKRIVSNYHSGKIFVKWSEVDKGTCFRILLNK